MTVATPATEPLAARRPEDQMLPVGGLLGYGLQHILSMVGGVIAVPLLIGEAAGLDAAGRATLVASALLVSGLATLLQSLGAPYLGSQLPLVQGLTFASVSTVLAIIGQDGTVGLQRAFGACMIGGAIAFLLVPLFAQIIRFFPPVVTGSVITVIGLSLMPVAGTWIAGRPMLNGSPNPRFAEPSNLALGLITLGCVVALSKARRLARLAILLALVLGTLVAVPMGKIVTPAFASMAPLAFPTPFAFGAPSFSVAAILTMLIVFIVIMVETTADIVAVAEIVGTECPGHRVADGLRADMLSSALAPALNTFPATAFAQNVGLVALTGIKSRYVVAVGGGLLALLGLSPWLAALIGMIPQPVLGGAGIALFGSVAASGIRTLSKVDYDGNNNLLIVAISVGFGIIPAVVPGFWERLPHTAALVLESGISACAMVAFFLNIFFNMLGKGAASPVATLRAHGPARAIEHEDLATLPDYPRSSSRESEPRCHDVPAAPLIHAAASTQHKTPTHHEGQ